ncbi:SMP-30/gluconolactonase/LRE family protein [Pseudahrensia aquimaris]|uniref:SMP-30/gluconolactonase/LRE family protein n=1 Tax=Pseudahrensia aquimaris TaxID=744461 RepID=A0ABW3FEA3_9HYPH
MSNITPFGPTCILGEGPLWHPLRERLYWFDIIKGELYSSNKFGGQMRRWNFGEPASACGWLDEDTLVVATASGLQKFDVEQGHWETLVDMEADNETTRSNDGRVGPDGSFWIGTMGRALEPAVGAYYRLKRGKLECLFDRVSIPNATCFSPNGKTAYLADTRKQVIWRWPLDDHGNPVGEREVHINLRDENLNPDGAVCDAEGYLWNAQWGASRLARYAPDGSLDRVIDLPISQPTCPAFGGDDLRTLYMTSASEGLSKEQLSDQPDAGRCFMMQVDVPGVREHQLIV